LTEGQLGFADKRSTTDLREFLTLTTPRIHKSFHAAALIPPNLQVALSEPGGFELLCGFFR